MKFARNLVGIVILIGLSIFLYLKGAFSKIPDGRASYTRGIILERFTVGRGSRLMRIKYNVHHQDFFSSYPRYFCDECEGNCCKIGDTVIVKYDTSNPEKIELIHQLPKEKFFTE